MLERAGKRSKGLGSVYRSDTGPGGYFAAYADPAIHMDMLSDTARMDAYAGALAAAGEAGALDGATVLDVGCGTGVLAVLAAKAGAAAVYAVDGSPSLARVATAFAAANGVADVVTVIAARVEELSLADLGGARVDVVVSEWMGYALIYESMLPSVLYARDNLLAPGGLLLPSAATLVATLFAAPGSLAQGLDSDSEEMAVPPAYVLRKWDEDARYGLVWRSLAPFLTGAPLPEPGAPAAAVLSVDELDPQLCLSRPTPFAQLDLMALSQDELTAGSPALSNLPLALSATHAGSVAGIAVSFDVAFPFGSVVLSTGPTDPPTHWAQTLLHIPPQSQGQVVQDDVVAGTLSLAPDFAPGEERNLALSLALSGPAPPLASFTATYAMDTTTRKPPSSSH